MPKLADHGTLFKRQKLFHITSQLLNKAFFNSAILLIMTRPVITQAHYSALRMRRSLEMSRPGPDVSSLLCPVSPGCSLSRPSPNAELPRLPSGFLTQWPHQLGLATSTWTLCRNNKFLHIPPSCKQWVGCVWVDFASVSAVRGNIARASEEPWRGVREDSWYWRASHHHATVTAKEYF